MRIVGWLTLAGCLWLAGCGEAPERPNLLLVSIDTLRADALACYGGAPDVGERICALGDEGSRYVWAFSTAPTTSPSVASLLTSRWTPDHGVTQNLKTVLTEDQVTLAELLRDAGYATAGVVSNPLLHGRRHLQQGFDHYDHEMTRRERNRPGFAERDALATTDAALAWLHDASEEPWFLWVHYQDPHGPYEPPASARASDPPGGTQLPLLEDNFGRGGIPKYQRLPGLRTREAYVERYRNEIRYLDREVGRLIDGVDALGRAPAVLLTADHGEALGEDDYYFAHGHSAGLEQLRVPLLWRPPPGARGGGAVSKPVSLVDVAPTLLFVADVLPPTGFVGRPLQVDTDATRALFAEAARQAAVIHEHDYYARDRDPGAITTPDGLPWTDEHPALPARTARLTEDGSLPAYQAAGPEPALEPELAGYLSAHPVRRAAEYDDVPDELRRQLEALGYSDR